MSPRELELPMPYSTGSSPLACRPSTRRPSAERLLSLRPPFAPQTQAVRARTTRDDSPGALVQWVFVCPAVYRLSTNTSFPYPVTVRFMPTLERMRMYTSGQRSALW